MCQTFFLFPHSVFALPVFGLGWALIIWVIGTSVWIWRRLKMRGWTAETREPLPWLLVVGLVIAFVLPRLEAKGPNGDVLGLPVRGYGTFMALGVMGACGLTVYRGTRRGLSLDTMSSIALPVILAGIVGARLFFVIEYWENFQMPSWSATLLEIVKFTEGGLVVFGSLIGGFLAYVWFAVRHKLPMLVLGDVIAPGVILGMAIGRIGCLMNGCCYGGLCEHGAWGIQFPRFSAVEQRVVSPPYSHQLAEGQLHGFLMESRDDQPFVKAVDPGSAAELQGLRAGGRIVAINGIETPTTADAHNVLIRSGPDISLSLSDGQHLKWTIGVLPDKSRSVHPTQIYSSIGGFLICMVLLSAESFLNRSGAVIAMFLTLYPLVRFLEEMIRDDEPGQLGTSLTISQLVSLGTLGAALVMWWAVARTKPGFVDLGNDRMAAPRPT